MKCLYFKNGKCVAKRSSLDNSQRVRIRKYIDKGWKSTRIAEKVGATTMQVAGVKAHHQNPDSFARG